MGKLVSLQSSVPEEKKDACDEQKYTSYCIYRFLVVVVICPVRTNTSLIKIEIFIRSLFGLVDCGWNRIIFEHKFVHAHT